MDRVSDCITPYIWNDVFADCSYPSLSYLKFSFIGENVGTKADAEGFALLSVIIPQHKYISSDFCVDRHYLLWQIKPMTNELFYSPAVYEVSR